MYLILLTFTEFHLMLCSHYMYSQLLNIFGVAHVFQFNILLWTHVLDLDLLSGMDQLQSMWCERTQEIIEKVIVG